MKKFQIANQANYEEVVALIKSSNNAEAKKALKSPEFSTIVADLNSEDTATVEKANENYLKLVEIAEKEGVLPKRDTTISPAKSVGITKDGEKLGKTVVIGRNQLAGVMLAAYNLTGKAIIGASITPKVFYEDAKQIYASLANEEILKTRNSLFKPKNSELFDESNFHELAEAMYATFGTKIDNGSSNGLVFDGSGKATGTNLGNLDNTYYTLGIINEKNPDQFVNVLESMQNFAGAFCIISITFSGGSIMDIPVIVSNRRLPFIDSVTNLLDITGQMKVLNEGRINRSTDLLIGIEKVVMSRFIFNLDKTQVQIQQHDKSVEMCLAEVQAKLKAAPEGATFITNTKIFGDYMKIDVIDLLKDKAWEEFSVLYAQNYARQQQAFLENPLNVQKGDWSQIPAEKRPKYYALDRNNNGIVPTEDELANGSNGRVVFFA